MIAGRFFCRKQVGSHSRALGLREISAHLLRAHWHPGLPRVWQAGPRRSRIGPHRARQEQPRVDGRRRSHLPPERGAQGSGREIRRVGRLGLSRSRCANRAPTATGALNEPGPLKMQLLRQESGSFNPICWREQLESTPAEKAMASKTLI